MTEENNKAELAALANIGDTLINIVTDMTNELRTMNAKLSNLKPAPTPSGGGGGYQRGGGGGYQKKQGGQVSAPFVSEVIKVEDKGTRARIQLAEGNQWTSTFDRTVIDMCLEALNSGFPIEFTTVEQGQYVNIKTAEPAF